MKKNMNTLDRVIRVAISGGLLYLGSRVYGVSTVAIGLATVIVSIVPLMTALLVEVGLDKATIKLARSYCQTRVTFGSIKIRM